MSQAKEMTTVRVPLAIRDVVREAARELERALGEHPPLASPHEGYAVIAEELSELWREVRRKGAARTPARMRVEAIQVAAMGMRFALELCSEEGDTDGQPGA